jgi:hypothetical protein
MMPQRYAGRRLPAVLYAFPFDYFVALVLVSAGVLINFYPQLAPGSIQALPWIWSLLFRVMCLAAGVLVTLGLTKGQHRWSFMTEMAGMYLAAGVFGTYSIGLVWSVMFRPSASLAAIFLVGLSVACVIRAMALGIESTLRLQLLVEAGEIQRSQSE